MSIAKLFMQLSLEEHGMSSKVAYAAIDKIEEVFLNSGDSPEKYQQRLGNNSKHRGFNPRSAERRGTGNSYVGRTPPTNLEGLGGRGLGNFHKQHDQNVLANSGVIPYYAPSYRGRKLANLDYETKEANVFTWLAKGVPRWGENLAGWATGAGRALQRGGKGVGENIAQRYRAGMQAAAGEGAGVFGQHARGVTDVINNSRPVSGLLNATDPSRRWMSIAGPDRMSMLFNTMAGLEGARQGKEVGGTGGMIAGGLAGFGGSRIGMGLSEYLRKGAYRGLQQAVGQGHYTALAAGSGRANHWLGSKLQQGVNWARGQANPQGFMANRVLNRGGFLERMGARMRAPQEALRAGGGYNVVTPGGKTVTLSQEGGLPGLSLMAGVPLMIGAYGLGTNIGDRITDSAFNAYKRTSANMHNRQQLQDGRANMMRRMSPELRSMGYNPYSEY